MSDYDDPYVPPDELIPDPADSLAEELLGALLVAPRMLDEVAQVLTGAEFADARHELIYKAILRVSTAGDATPDPLTVADELGDDLRTVTARFGPTYLHELYGRVATPANAGWVAERIADHHRSRLEQGIGRDLATGGIDAATASARLDDLASTRSAGLAAEILDRDQLHQLPHADPLIDKVLSRNSYAVLRGRDGSFKSFLAIDWSLCLATGKPWQRYTAERVPVLYVAAEGAHGIQQRVDAWESAWQTTVDPAWFRILPRAVDLFTGTEVPDLVRVIRAGRYGMVVLDTLRRMSGRADGNGSDMGLIVDNVERIKRATDNGSALVIAHTDKGDNDSRGFSGIEDDADIVWHAKRDEDERLVLKLTKFKDGPDGRVMRLRATTHGDSLVIGSDSEAVAGPNTNEAQLKILDALNGAFALTNGAASSVLMEYTGLAKTTFYEARGTLLAKGLIVSGIAPEKRNLRLTDSGRSATIPEPPQATDQQLSEIPDLSESVAEIPSGGVCLRTHPDPENQTDEQTTTTPGDAA